MTLFDRINEVEFDNISRIDEQDQAKCDRLTFQYKEVKAELKNKIAFLTSYEEKNFSNFDAHNLTFLKLIEKLNDELVSINRSFFYEITRYFSDKYKVSISIDFVVFKDKEEINSNDVIDLIFENLEGVELGNAGFEELKEMLRGSIIKERQPYNQPSYKLYSISKNRLRLDDYLSYYQRYCYICK